ncbi:VanZ family protein [Streptomyces sp. NPDC052236]|uniref:VanZ family protein n=1 Tax=Streptomyces sp. NPDC052236 TaxID=3365686 RepID=UPI0037D0C412
MTTRARPASPKRRQTGVRVRTAKKSGNRVPGKPRLSAPVRVLAMLLAFAGMVAFGVVLARLTLEPSAASVALTHSNLRPGDSIRAYLAQPDFRDTVKQLGGNIVLGMPFGVLLPVLVPQTRGLVRVAVVTAFVMMLVELVQGMFITGRAFDIDDVLLNTTGALLGYLLVGLWLGRAVHPRRRHWWHRFTKAG